MWWKNDYVHFNRKDIESSDNNLANYDLSTKSDIENTNSENWEFCIYNDITNKADINKAMEENPYKLHQEIEESKLRKISHSS